MPLHLLGKKSWNVYNKDNVERVRKDEAAAAAREETDEQRMQEEDAARRTAILRGEAPPTLPSPSPQPEGGKRSRDTREEPARHERKHMRRQRGEDDTDRDIRVARSDVDVGQEAKVALSGPKESQKNVSLVDHAGHINLFPAPDVKDIRKAEKNAEAEAEKAKNQKQNEDQYTMRFANAAGFKQGLKNPWYAVSSKSRNGDSLPAEQPSRNVWENEDPRRKERDQMRTSTNDPMAFMQRAQKQLKQSEQDREAWKATREKELKELVAQQDADDARRRARRNHRRRSRDTDSLDGFSLDDPVEGRHGRHKSESSHRRRHGHSDRHSRHEHSVRGTQRVREDRYPRP